MHSIGPFKLRTSVFILGLIETHLDVLGEELEESKKGDLFNSPKEK